MKSILFDMDGVLINTEPLHYEVWKEILKENGVSLDYEIYKGCIGSTRAYLYQLLLDGYGIDFRGNETIPERFAQLKNQHIKEFGTPRINGVEETIKYLYHKGYPMAVASSSSQKYIEYHMKELGIEHCFKELFSAERVLNPKPAPDVFLKTASCIGAGPKDCIVVEDSYNGTRAAKAAGMFCVGFKNPDSGNQDLSYADTIINNIVELKEIL